MILISASCSQNSLHPYSEKEKKEFTEDLKKRTFNFFMEQVDEPTWSIPDRFPTHRFTSISATGFGLAAYLVGIENGYISREEGANRVLQTLRWYWNAPQGADSSGVSGYKGFFYHFLEYGTGHRYKQVELSTVDTGLLMAGILACMSYFGSDNEIENEIRSLADSLYLRVEWDWAMDGRDAMTLGYHPESGFIDWEWRGYSEAMILVLLGMGSPTHPIPDSSWEVWCSSYKWDNFYGYDYIQFAPLFGHQFSHMFIDFRGIQDNYTTEKGIDYFENSRRATLANRSYAEDNPRGFAGYSSEVWGLTACDGPEDAIREFDGKPVQFYTYRARGADALEIIDDGTITPTAAGGSIPFTPVESIQALMNMKRIHGDSLYREYGFLDAFNMSYTIPGNEEPGWYNPDYLGIDQGPILIQLENHESGLIWNLMKKNKYIIAGLRKAGFSGGWLETIKE